MVLTTVGSWIISIQHYVPPPLYSLRIRTPMKDTINPTATPQEIADLNRKIAQALKKSFFKSPDYTTASIHTSALALLTTPLNHYKCALLQLILKEHADAMFSMLKAAEFSTYFYERAGALSFVNGCYSIGGNAFVKGYEGIDNDEMCMAIRRWIGDREDAIVEMMKMGKDCDVVDDYERYCRDSYEDEYGTRERTEDSNSVKNKTEDNTKNSSAKNNSTKNMNVNDTRNIIRSSTYIPATDTSIPALKLNYLYNAHVLYKKAQMPKTADLIKSKILRECIIQRKYEHAAYYACANTDVMRMLMFLNGGDDDELKMMDEQALKMMGVDECGGMLVEEILGRRGSEYELL
ncbi:hypothetical protein THOM_2962 [Trachipleistophora hominis]|uniref:Uncharacterized protein n=1 Tax=Trachipleistophora hominis TaxID=72359 RepID=L7JRL8_TRAHO|nr:hypothetical protein THOM_2962 [Trachipleistophora hominis]